MRGDSIYYDKKTGIMEAFRNVFFEDTDNKSILLGNYCWYNELTGEALAHGQALAKEYSNPQDTLFVHADTLRLYTYNMDTDSVYRKMHGYYHVRTYRSDIQAVCDSLVGNSLLKRLDLYHDPIVWSGNKQVLGEEINVFSNDSTVDSVRVERQALMVEQMDSAHYNQVAGKAMTAHFRDNQIYRNDVNGNVQTIYYMQEEDNADVTGLMYIESASISFYLTEGEIDKIAYKQNPAYVLYPMNMIPETQELKLKDFIWYYDRRPLRDSVFDRSIRATQREDVALRDKPRFRITERIDYDRRRLVENREWVDRVDQLTPEIIEWRNTRTSYKSTK